MIVGHFRAILFQALCLALTFVCLAAAIGQTNPILKSAEESPATSEIEQLFEKANELSAKEDYDAALPLFERILSLAENDLGRDDPQVGDILMIIGRLYRLKGDSTRALPYLKRSLGIKKSVFGKNSPELTNILMNLGLTCQAEQLNPAAIEYYERCLAIQDKRTDRDDREHSLSVNRFGCALSRSGKPPESSGRVATRASRSRNVFSAKSRLRLPTASITPL